jgi:hypothetical protein
MSKKREKKIERVTMMGHLLEWLSDHGTIVSPLEHHGQVFTSSKVPWPMKRPTMELVQKEYMDRGNLHRRQPVTTLAYNQVATAASSGASWQPPLLSSIKSKSKSHVTR